MSREITSTEIKKIIKVGKIVFGTETTLKNLKLGKIEKVLVSSNCPGNVEKSVLHYSSLSGAKAEKLRFANDELGVICKKPFSVSVFGVLKV